jgi:proline iminopeptidase
MIKNTYILLILIICCSSAFSQNKEQYITSDDSVRLFVKVSGQGPICIFIHGGPGAWSKSFEEMGGSNLETQLTMVYYDQRGCGRSESAKNKDYSLDRMVEDIENIRRSLGANKVFLLSHSFGGIIAINYAKKYADHLNGLILANSTLDIDRSLEGQIQHVNALIQSNFEVTNRDSILTTFLQARQKLAERGWAYKMLSDNKAVVDVLDRLDQTNPGDYDFAKNVWRHKEYFQDFAPDSKYIRISVLVITGTKDYSVGVDHYRSFHFPHQKVVHIDGGHMLYEEENPQFVNVVLAFTALSHP